jgi:hypothetical protein
VVPPPSGNVVLVRVGNEPPRPAGFVVYLAPGEHVFELHAGTANAKQAVVRAVAGVANDLNVPDLGAKSPEPKAAEFPTAWLVGGAALTAASAALPIALAIHTGNERDDAEALSVTSSHYPDAVASFEDARTAYWISYALPAAIAVATAIVVVLKMPRSEKAGGAWAVRF